MVLVDTPHERSYFRREVLSLYSKFAWVLGLMKTLSLFGVPRLVSRWTAKADPSVPADVTAQINAGMVRRESLAAAIDDLRSCKKALPWILEPDALGNLGDKPLSVITHGQPFPGPFAVLEDGWREGQERLLALSTNSRLIVADKANHMIHIDQPQVIVEAVRSVIESSREAVV
jgi:pimeloyl-ACP methyl ester carboxylesterase